jgi:hypothetical protein
MFFVSRFRASLLAANHFVIWHRTRFVIVQKNCTFTRNYNTSVILNMSSSGRVFGAVIAQSLQWLGCKLQAWVIVPFPVSTRHLFGVHYPHCPHWLWGPNSLTQCVLQALFPGVKWPGYTVDHSPPSCAVVNNEWRCTCTVHRCLHHILKDFTCSQ